MEETTKVYELRDLQSKDIFPTVKIISKIGINEFKQCFSSDDIKALVGEDKVDVEAIGLSVFLDVANVVLSHIPSCEEDIYLLLSGLSGMSKKEIAELPLLTFTEMIIDVVKKDEFKDFIKVVSKFLK